jgi:cytochrome P450
MKTGLFLQSGIQDPYEIYTSMLDKSPVYKDDQSGLWMLYSYEACDFIFKDLNAFVPETDTHGLNEPALRIVSKLTRLSNSTQHEIARETLRHLCGTMKPVSTGSILRRILTGIDPRETIDWVQLVAKKLPVAAIAESFGFESDDSHLITSVIEHLVKIMLPAKTDEQICLINDIAPDVYAVAEKHLMTNKTYRSLINTVSLKFSMKREEILGFFASNLIGLFIQAYDAGRGLLSNSLLQMIMNDKKYPMKRLSRGQVKSSVIETLRFDPPVHNTKRVATHDIVFKNVRVFKGEIMLLIVAAANRDAGQFVNPAVYDIERPNNNEHLTFGTGIHKCLAEHFSVGMTTEALFYLLDQYGEIQLPEQKIQYEPLINARLPCNLFISFSK